MDALARIEAERACERLVALYAHLSDGAGGVEDLFAKDGVLHVNRRLEGREAIRGARADRPPQVLTRHICSDVVIDVIDGQTARGTCYLTAYVLPEGGTELGLPAVVGQYHDEFALTDEGWKFSSRSFTPVLTRQPQTQEER